MTSRYFILIFLFLQVGCQTIMIEESPEPETKKGGYYLDDGPLQDVPDNLDKIPNATPQDEPLVDYANRPYKVFDVKYSPMKELKPYKEKGYASWYGKKYHGNKTSIGEIYDMYEMTGAHKTLPLPCYVEVTNLKNNKQVIIRINDRGPFIKDRIIDLSYAAAHRLDIIEKGSELVEIKVINPRFEKQEKVIVIQAGVFTQKENAQQLKNKMERLQLPENIKISIDNETNLFYLRLGPVFSNQEAQEIKDLINTQLDLNSFIIQ